VAQQMLILLSQLAHNLVQWIKDWMVKALQQKEKMQQKAEQMMQSFQQEDDDVKIQDDGKIQLAIKSVQERGMKRFVRQIFALNGTIISTKGQIQRIVLNPLYPLVDRIRIALQALLQTYQITVVLGKT
jgi:hypothetical protein